MFCIVALTCTSIRGTRYEPRNLIDVRNGVVASQKGFVSAVSGSALRISQEFRLVRPVLVPPWTNSPGADGQSD